MNETLKHTFIATASEIKSSRLYMTIKTTMFTVPAPNLNGVECTEEFLDEIVANQKDYIGLPLCADIRKLERGQYDKLGHCYNPVTGKFSSTMIGSFYKFKKEEIDGGYALVGYARVLKRNEEICKALAELFAEGNLKFSFEISCGATEEKNNIVIIDKDDSNFIEGMAVVSFPACPDAVASQLVAEITGMNVAEEERKEAEAMPNEENVNVQNTEEAVENKTNEIATAETVTETAETNDVNAQVYVTVEHTEIDSVSAYDNETGVDTYVRDEHTEISHGVVEESGTVAEAETIESAAKEKEDDSEEEEDVCPECGKKKSECTCEEDASCKKKAEIENEQIAELYEIVASLKNAIAEMQKAQEEHVEETVVAEQHIVAENPFVEDTNMVIGNTKKYSLLESATVEHYSLLDKE